jgi:hypothetical protein
MIKNPLYQELGQFIVMFQRVEEKLIDLLVLMVDADDEFIRILANELEYSKRVKVADVMFNRFVDLRSQLDRTAKERFHKLMAECLELGELRNDMVHSYYAHFVNLDSALALRQKTSKLKASKGVREVAEKDLSAGSFTLCFNQLSAVHQKLEDFRLKIIDWQCPLE